jgi:UDP-glucose 4-epimerase
LSSTPISRAGICPAAASNGVQDFARAYGFQIAALRYFNAAGASQAGDLGEVHVPETHLIPLVLQVAQGRREKIHIFGDDYPTPDGTCVRDYIHVEDLADAHLRALSVVQVSGGPLAINLGTGTGFSVREVIETARRITGHAIPAAVSPRREGDPPELVSGGTRARDVLGWIPARPGIAEIVEDAWRFQRAHPDGYARS